MIKLFNIKIKKKWFIKTKHNFHLVDSSLWPFLSATSVFMLTVGLITWMQHIYGAFLLLTNAILLLTYVLFLWWRDIIREATFENQHTLKVKRGLKLGMFLFILSEIMFFFAFFWAFFHSSLSPVFNIGGIWPPKNIYSINILGIPLTNTILLLSSGITATWSHHAIINSAKKYSIIAILITIMLAILFTLLQIIEYINSPFTISDSIYGSCFYLTTGFHGFHVLIGTIALLISFIRIVLNHFTKTHHFGFESALWYWHFVDVVWIFLLISIYWWGQ